MKILDKFKFAISGINDVYQESSFRIQCYISVLVIALSLYYQLNPTEFSIILLCIGAVLVSEIFNTAVEKVCNIFSQGWLLDEIRIIKDMSAGSVAIISIISIAIGLLIFVPKILGV